MSTVVVVPGRPAWLSDAYAFCRDYTHRHNENFTVASWLLPRRLRPSMYAVYAFCRQTDDLGDEAPGDRLALLDAWQEALEVALTGRPAGPILDALADTARRFQIPSDLFLRLIEANRMDQRVSAYETYADLRHYCWHSAEPVGRMVLCLFGYRDEERGRLADATCTALQLANFWQDVGRDLEKGRVYIPREDLRRFGVAEDDLRRRTADGRFRALMAFEVDRARELFRQGQSLEALVGPRLRLDVRLFRLGGEAVLDAIERAGYDVLARRPAVSRRRKAALILRALLGGR